MRVVWEGVVRGWWGEGRSVWVVQVTCIQCSYMYISDLSHSLLPSLRALFLLRSLSSSSPPSFLLPSFLPPSLPPSSSPPSLLQALSEALLQVRADLVETTQKTLEGRARQEQQDANVQQLVDKKTSELQVCDISREMLHYRVGYVCLLCLG